MRTKKHIHVYISDCIDPYGTGIFTVRVPNTCRCTRCGRKRKDPKTVLDNWERYKAYIECQNGAPEIRRHPIIQTELKEWIKED